MKEEFLSLLVVALLLISFYNYYENYSLQNQVEKIYGEVKEMKNCTVPVPITPTEKNYDKFLIVQKSIPIVAVSSNGEGVMGNLTVKLIPGNNNVLINTNPFLETDIQYSVNKAVAVAKMKTNYHYDKDFIFDFRAGNAQLIGGGSAGAAETIATIAAIENKNLKKDAVITGTINLDGTIGRVGGIIEKAKAVGEAGYKYFLIPEGQSKVTYYEKEVTEEPLGFGINILNTRYVPKTIDLKKVAKEQWGLNVVEVSNIW